MRPIDVYDKLAEHGLSIDQALEFTERALSESRSVSGRSSVGHGLTSKRAFGAGPATAGSAGLRFLSSLGLGEIAKAYGVPLTYLALAAPPAAGYFGGKALAKSMDAGSDDIADIQEQELVQELLTNAAALRQRKQLRDPV